ncbi:MAG: two-component system LytT family response regulator [Salibacteraceae bacterium]|jgi:two-component system LytT family response regulator
MKIIIIDDETSVRNNLKQIIETDVKEATVIGEAHSVKTGLQLIKDTDPDLLLLDINLTDGSGFGLLEDAPSIDFQVIFITAYDEFAIKAFQFNAIDYLLKPIDSNLLVKGIEKAQNLTNKNFITKKELQTVLNSYSKVDEDKQLALHESSKISFVELRDIVRCTADSNYTIFHFANATQKVTSKTLKNYEQILPKSMFYRVSPSCIVNLKYVKEYFKGGSVLLKDGTEIEISRRRKEDFLNVLKQRSA